MSTGRGRGRGRGGRGGRGDGGLPNPPPPMTMEQLIMNQTQVIQALGQAVAAMHQAQQQPPPPPPPQPRDRRAEFMKGHPPVFTHSADPMDAEDWLRAIERELDVAQCTDQEKVLYGPHQLRGAAQQWWESYRLAHNNPNTITWQEFTERFRAHHVPADVMSLKKEEFLALTQGAMSVSEYRDKFLQLSRYCPEEVDTDPKKQYRFLKGLVDPLRYQLMNHTFPNCQHLIDRAIVTENTRREMEEKKRKRKAQQSSSNTRPKYSGSTYYQNHPTQSTGQQGNGQVQHSNNQAQHHQTPISTPVKAGTPVQSGSNNCFKCGGTGHWSQQCPQKNTPQQNPRGGSTTPASGQQRSTTGQVNYVSAEAMQGTPNIMLGTFFVDLAPCLDPF